MDRTLHVVNGDVVAEKLREGIGRGDILAWREVYTHGPLSPDPDSEGSRAVRARYLERTMGVPSADYLRISEAQQEALRGFRRYEEVVLWFEHDLFDQTMLCYLLHWFAGRTLSGTRLSLVSIGSYPGIEPFRGLGQLSPEQLRALSGSRIAIGGRELGLGSACWQAYASDQPDRLQRLLDEDTSALPFARDAFRCHLSRFPALSDGLGIVERLTLETMRPGAASLPELFDQVGNRLHELGMGDLQYRFILEKLSREPYPLLRIPGLKPVPAAFESPDRVLGCEAELTELGKAFANGDGERDWVAMQGIDEWYGGIHLQGTSPRWRWDPAAGRLESGR